MRLRQGMAIGGAGAGVVAAHVAVAIFFDAHDPYSTEILPPCPILATTGWQCPACGGTRAMYSLLHGDLVGSFAMNPLLLSLYVVGILIVFSFAATAKARPRLGNGLAFAGLAVATAAVLYSGIIRNLLAAS